MALLWGFDVCHLDRQVKPVMTGEVWACQGALSGSAGGGTVVWRPGWGPGLIPQLGLERLLARSQNRRSVLHPRGLQGRGDFSDVAVKQGRSAQAGRGSASWLDLGEGPLRAWLAGGC